MPPAPHHARVTTHGGTEVNAETHLERVRADQAARSPERISTEQRLMDRITALEQLQRRHLARTSDREGLGSQDSGVTRKRN